MEHLSTKVLKPLRSIFLITLIGIHGACTPLDEVKAFGKSARDVSEQTLATYATLDRSLIDARRNTAVLKGIKLNPDLLRSPLKGSLNNRIEMLGALGQYATVLESLATKDNSASMDQSSRDLASGLRSLSTTYTEETSKSVGLGDSSIGVLSTAVRSSAGLYTEMKRKNAIREIVATTDPAIQKIAAILPRELRSAGSTLQGHMSNETTAFLTAINEAAPGLPPEQRLEAGRKAQALQEKEDAVKLMFDAVANSVLKMGEAHSKLAVAVNTSDFTDAQFREKLSELQKYAKDVSSFYKTVSKPPAGE